MVNLFRDFIEKEEYILPKIQYLSDKEIQLNSKSDLLGSSIYVDQLYEMIDFSMETNEVESIALFGEWGSGKTSVVNSLKKRIDKTELNGQKIRFFSYNAWQYNNDSFRKNFIASIIDDEEKRKKYLNKVYSSETETHIVLNQNVKKYWWVLLLFVFGLVLMLFFSFDFSDIDLENIIKLIGQITSLGFATLIIELFLRKIAIEKQVSVIKDYSPYDFVNDFQYYLSDKSYYSIFLIDDIDRCSPNQALEILETVKGLLKSTNNSNYLFLIPLDKERIISILKNERQYSLLECQNYFSKLFDLSLRVKKMGRSNLFGMAKLKSEEMQLQLSNRSLSLLTDFIFDTPRDVKNHLNSLATLSRLIYKQTSLGYIKSDLDGITLDEYIKLYILEIKWPDFFDYLTANKNVIETTIDSKILEENDFENLNNKMELSKFLDNTPIYSLKYIDSYIELKNDNILINSNLLSKMTKKINFEINENDYEDPAFIDTFEYFYNIYIAERRLISDYLGNVISMYFGFLNNIRTQNEFMLNSKIDLDEISRFLYSWQENDINPDKFIEISFNEVSKIQGYTENIKVRNFYIRYIEPFMASKKVQYMIDFLKAENLNTLRLNENIITRMLLVIMENDSDNSELDSIISTSGLKVSNLQQLLFDAIKHKRMDVIVSVANLSDDVFSGNEKEIKNILTVSEELRKPPLSMKDEIDYLSNELSILVKGIKCNCSELIQYIDSMNFNGYHDTYLTNILNIQNIDTEYLGLLNNYISLVELYDEDNNGLSLVSKTVNLLSRNKIAYVALNIIKEYKKEYANELYILALSNDDDQIIDEYISFLTEEKDASLFENWLQLVKNKSNTSISFNYINFAPVVLKYRYFENNLFIKMSSISSDVGKLFISQYSFKEITGNKKLLEFIKSLKVKDIRRLMLLDKIMDMDDYILCLDIINKNSNLAQYHNAFRRIIENTKSVDNLREIHDKYSKNTDVLDKTDLNTIRRKVEEQFPNYKEYFTGISFKE